jgi:hypothetical protein
MNTKQTAIAACRQLVAAYDVEVCDSIDWEDLDAAYALAVNALKSVRHENRSAKLAKAMRKTSRK